MDTNDLTTEQLKQLIKEAQETIDKRAYTPLWKDGSEAHIKVTVLTGDDANDQDTIIGLPNGYNMRIPAKHLKPIDWDTEVIAGSKWVIPQMLQYIESIKANNPLIRHDQLIWMEERLREFVRLPAPGEWAEKCILNYPGSPTNEPGFEIIAPVFRMSKNDLLMFAATCIEVARKGD